MRPITRRSRTGVLPFALFVTLTGGQLIADTDPYLSAIEREASVLDTPANVQRLDPTDTRPASVRARDFMTPGMDLEGFEAELERRFPGTSMMYKSLAKDIRLTIYEGYRQDNRIAVIRRHIAYSM